MPEPVAIALDVGGTKVAAGLVTAEGRIVRQQRTPQEPVGRPDLEPTLAAARTMLAEAADRRLEVVGIGAGFPEYVGADGLLRSSDVMQWHAQPLGELGRLAPGVLCTVDSDVRVAALAEARCGAGAGLESFLYVTLGTGLSSTFVLRGRPWAGARGEAIALGELGVPASLDAGWRGNVEQYASGTGIARRYPDRVGGADEVERLAADGDATAAEVLRTAAEALGHVIGDVVCVLDPAAVVLGGGLGTADGALGRALRSAFSRRLSARPDAPPLLIAALGPGAGLVGAGLVAHAQRAPTSSVARNR